VPPYGKLVPVQIHARRDRQTNGHVTDTFPLFYAGCGKRQISLVTRQQLTTRTVLANRSTLARPAATESEKNMLTAESAEIQESQTLTVV